MARLVRTDRKNHSLQTQIAENDLKTHKRLKPKVAQLQQQKITLSSASVREEELEATVATGSPKLDC